MNRAYYQDPISSFVSKDSRIILAELAQGNEFDLQATQRDAWLEQIDILKPALQGLQGQIFFEFSIPRMGHRVDVVLLIDGIVFVLEFKSGESKFHRGDIEQVWDYGLDFVNFHGPSHQLTVVPMLIATRAKKGSFDLVLSSDRDKLLFPVQCNPELIHPVIDEVLSYQAPSETDASLWYHGSYSPTPTIIEAASKLYRDHSVEDISRSEAAAYNLKTTTTKIDQIIASSRLHHHKSICFVTGVPGAGKTLVGLNIATQHQDQATEEFSVFLSGNGPLVAVLREALIRDKVRHEAEQGRRVTKSSVGAAVKSFIQNVHNFRDEGIRDPNPPHEHVTLFDEAQRSWTLEQTSYFMQRKKGLRGFNQSEPEFLISYMDRWPDWAVIVCLVGGGQEINTGEAGIDAWLTAIRDHFPHWHIFVSRHLSDSEYRSSISFYELSQRVALEYCSDLHLRVSLRSFRAEKLSQLVKELLDLDVLAARQTLSDIRDKYPIVLTRDKRKAMQWLKKQARGSERYGIVVSSQAERLKPLAINVKAEVNPIHWFLNDRDDVRSSYFLEDVATEFHIQGLELDWVCVTWDADLRLKDGAWDQWSFKGHRWEHIRTPERKKYQINAYRVLLTRARQGMVICVPEGNPEDKTRLPEFYDGVYGYLREVGMEELE